MPEAFARQVAAAPHVQMWCPTHEEMLGAGVLTRRSMGGETAAVATALRSKESLAAEFRGELRFIAAIPDQPDIKKILTFFEEMR